MTNLVFLFLDHNFGLGGDVNHQVVLTQGFELNLVNNRTTQNSEVITPTGAVVSRDNTYLARDNTYLEPDESRPSSEGTFI